MTTFDSARAYIFDYGGTLDTAGCHWGKVLWHAYQKVGIAVTEQQFREAYVHAERTLGANPIIQPTFTFRKTLEVKLRIELEYLMTSGYWDVGEQEYKSCHGRLLDEVYGGVCREVAHSREVLEQLHSRYPMVLVSNFYGNINEVLREFSLQHLFVAVVESAVVGVRKLNPQIFRLGVEALGMQPQEVIVVGDSFYKDIEPAKKLGCHTVWFKGEGWTEEHYDEQLPDKVIADLAELIG